MQLEILATAIRQEREIKGMHIGEEEMKLLLLTGNTLSMSKILGNLYTNS